MKETNKTYSENWGGARKGAGKKPTGRKKVNFYIDENEEKMLRKELEKYRSNGVTQQLEKRSPNSKYETSENQDSKLRDKNEEVVKKINAAAERQAKIEDTIKNENNPSISKYNYLPRIPVEAENKKAVDYDKYESKNHLKRIKRHPRYKHPAFVELRRKYRYTATLRAVVYKNNKIYIWFSPKATKSEEIFRSINEKSQIYDMSLKDIFDIFGYKAGYVPELKILLD